MTSEVSGTVRLFGELFEGATVKLFEQTEKQTDRKKAAVKTTDSNGEYVFTSHPDAIEGQVQKWHVVVRAVDQNGRPLFSYGKPYVEADLTPTTLRLADTESFAVSDGQTETNEAINQEQGSTLTVEQGGQANTTTDITL